MRFFLRALEFLVFCAAAGCAGSRSLGGARSLAARDTMRAVPRGTVQRGGVSVTVPAFAIDRVPVTVRDYWDFTAATGARVSPADPEEGVPDALRRAHAFDGAEPPRRYLAHPMVGVTFAEAEAFCAWRGARLPTRDQWLRAVYGDDARPYPWGAFADTSRTNSSESGAGDTAPVLTHPRGAGPFDVADGVGQVMEWTRDEDGPRRVVLGSSWREPLRARGETAQRSAPVGRRSLALGFRCVRDVGR